jgi:hypothetical protein
MPEQESSTDRTAILFVLGTALGVAILFWPVLWPLLVEAWLWCATPPR